MLAFFSRMNNEQLREFDFDDADEKVRELTEELAILIQNLEVF